MNTTETIAVIAALEAQSLALLGAGVLALRHGWAEGRAVPPWKRPTRQSASPPPKDSPVLPAGEAGKRAGADGQRRPDGRTRYNAHRDTGLSPEEACTAAEIAPRTARTYEAERRARAVAA